MEPTNTTSDTGTSADAVRAALHDSSAAPPDDAAPSTSHKITIYNSDLIAVAGRKQGTVRAPRIPKRVIALFMVAMLALAAFATVNFGPGETSADAAVYQRLFLPKESHRYRFEMTMDGAVEVPGTGRQPMTMSVSMELVERTVAVDDDGVATVRQVIKDMDIRLNGERAPQTASGLSMELRIAPDGKVLSVDGLDGAGLGELGPAGEMIGPESMGPLLPPHAVAPGDEWTISETLPIPFADTPITATTTNRLVRLEVTDGVDIAVIRQDTAIPMDMRVAFAELLELARASGQPVPDAGLPKGAVFVYDGDIQLSSVQTIERTTGRPIAVSGEGLMDLGMRVEGVPGADTGRVGMHFDVGVSLRQI